MNYFGLLRVNQFSYRYLLECKVFPVMKQTLWLAKFSWTVWQQDDAKPHQDGDEMAIHHLPGQNSCHQVIEGGHLGPLLQPMWFLSLGVTERESGTTSPSPCKHQNMADLKKKFELSLARSQKWCSRSPSWTWRRGRPSWLGWKTHILRQEASCGVIK